MGPTTSLFTSSKSVECSQSKSAERPPSSEKKNLAVQQTLLIAAWQTCSASTPAD